MKTIIFQHIPKTAGNSFLDFLLPNFPVDVRIDLNENLDYAGNIERLRTLNADSKKRLKLIYGHLPFGVHEFVPQPTEYIAIFRNPVDRVVSHYYYVLEQPRHPLYEHVTSRKWTLKDYARSQLTGEINNGMTRLLCGRAEIDSLRGHGECTEEHFHEAMHHLRTSFAAVGILEKFELSLHLLRKIYGWPVKAVSNKNRTQKRASLREIDEETTNVIAEHNKWDLLLYDEVVSIFNRLCQEHKVKIPRSLTLKEMLNRCKAFLRNSR